MSIRYKIKKDSPTGLKFGSLLNHWEAIREKNMAIIKELGFSAYASGYGMAWGGFSGVVIKGEVDLSIFKEVRNHHPNVYKPKLNTKKGKELHEKLKGIKGISYLELNMCVDISCIWGCIGFKEASSDFYLITIPETWDYRIPNDCIEITREEYLKLSPEPINKEVEA